MSGVKKQKTKKNMLWRRKTKKEVEGTRIELEFFFFDHFLR